MRGKTGLQIADNHTDLIALGGSIYNLCYLLPPTRDK